MTDHNFRKQKTYFLWRELVSSVLAGLESAVAGGSERMVEKAGELFRHEYGCISTYLQYGNLSCFLSMKTLVMQSNL